MKDIAQLINALMELVSAGGKKTAGLAMLVGLALIPAGWWLAVDLPGPDHVWPLMFGVSAFGGALCLMGLAGFWGNRPGLGAEDLADIEPVVSGRDRACAQRHDLPFWVCGDCRIVCPGPAIDRCGRCGSPSSFAAARSEDERAAAVAMMPAN